MASGPHPFHRIFISDISCVNLALADCKHNPLFICLTLSDLQQAASSIRNLVIPLTHIQLIERFCRLYSAEFSTATVFNSCSTFLQVVNNIDPEWRCCVTMLTLLYPAKAFTDTSTVLKCIGAITVARSASFKLGFVRLIWIRNLAVFRGELATIHVASW